MHCVIVTLCPCCAVWAVQSLRQVSQSGDCVLDNCCAFVALCVSSPLCVQRFELQLQPGDIIVTGSDGLWDNIFAEEAATIASKCRDKGETATTAAQVLCR